MRFILRYYKEKIKAELDIYSRWEGTNRDYLLFNEDNKFWLRYILNRADKRDLKIELLECGAIRYDFIRPVVEIEDDAREIIRNAKKAELTMGSGAHDVFEYDDDNYCKTLIEKN